MRLQMPQVYRGFLSLPCLELARIGSLHFTFAASPSDQISDEKAIDTFATRLSAEPLSVASYCVPGAVSMVSIAPPSHPPRIKVFVHRTTSCA